MGFMVWLLYRTLLPSRKCPSRSYLMKLPIVGCLLLGFLAWAQADVPSFGEPWRSRRTLQDRRYNAFTVKNPCSDFTFYLAVGYNFPGRQWLISGWFELGPHRTKTFTLPAGQDQQLFIQDEKGRPVLWDTGYRPAHNCVCRPDHFSVIRTDNGYTSYATSNGISRWPSDGQQTGYTCKELGTGRVHCELQTLMIWPPWNGENPEGRILWLNERRCN